jgi:uncharacterized membrane protein YfcA
MLGTLLGHMSLGEIASLAAALVAAGAVTGLLAGLFGVGGGGVTVPVLYQMFIFLDVPAPVRMPLAVGTALAIIVPTSITSFRAHHARGMVDSKVLRLWALPCFAGVVLGSAIAAIASPAVFKFVFVAIAGLTSLRLLSGRDWRLADELPGKQTMRIIGFVIGLSSTLMGVAGGALGNMTMMIYGQPIHRSVATTAGLGVVISIPGTIGYMLAGLPQASLLPPLSIGFVSVIGFALVAPVSMLVAPLGAGIAHRFSRRKLEIGFGLFLAAVAVRFFVSLFTDAQG